MTALFSDPGTTATRPGPALSATTDKPGGETSRAAYRPDIGVDGRPPLSSEAAPVVQPARPAPATAPQPAAPEAASRPVESAPIDAEEKAALARLEQARTELARAIPEPAAAARQKPQRADFNDPYSFDDALIEWAATNAIHANRHEEALAQRQRLSNDVGTATGELWKARKAKVIEEFPDFSEVAESDDVQIAEPMAHAILAAANGPDLAYHLGKNRDEAARIAKLTPGQQIFEIGQLAAKLAASKPARSPSAPGRPAGSRATAKSPAEPTMSEYAAMRQPQLDAERRGFFSSRASKVNR